LHIGVTVVIQHTNKQTKAKATINMYTDS